MQRVSRPALTFRRWFAAAPLSRPQDDTAATACAPGSTPGSSPGRQLALTVIAIISVVAAGSALYRLIPLVEVGHVESVLRQVQAAIMFGAASLGLLSGRWAARTSVGFACAALLVLAFAGAVSGTAVGQIGFLPVMSTVGAALAVALLLAAAAAPEVNDGAAFRRLVTRESAPIAVLTVVALTPVVDSVLVAGMTMPVPFRMVLSAAVALGWLGVGARVLRLNQPSLEWLPSVLVILSMEAVVRGFVGLWSGSLLVALGLNALAGTITLVGAAMAGYAALVSKNSGNIGMLNDLIAMRHEEGQYRAEENERLHEVRSVLAGLRAATGSLRKYEDSLDPGVRRRLEDAVGAELSRLNQLVDPRIPEVTEGLDLEAVVMSVVVAQREQGLLVTTDLVDVSVRGRATEIATLVSDLLVNARVHAPGSPVRLTARVDGGFVVLEVRDWGPGVPAAEAERVFDRSYRGARDIAAGVPGCGLGLFNARRLARQMQGDLRLHAPDGGGCCFVATLPVSESPVTAMPFAVLPLAALPLAGLPVAALQNVAVPITRQGDDEVLEALEATWTTGGSQDVGAIPGPDVRPHQDKTQHPDGRDENLTLPC